MAFTKTLSAGLIAVTVGISGLSSAHAADTPPKTSTTRPAKADPGKGGSALDRFEATVKSLDLTEAQKPKIDKYFDAARAEMKALPADADSKEREQKAREISTKLRNEIGEVLTNEQKADLIKKMPAPVDTDTMIEHIKTELNTPGSKLTAEQKANVNEVLDQTKKKLDTLREESRQSHVDNRVKIQDALAEMKQKLSEILSAK